ncbi:MAG: thioredoxin domain-containing protein [Flavihumibacter sp.]
MNRLASESSPYLLQHAHNPVNWYPWGADALNLAREKDLPILVSIGYAACHWCHVMERESFEDEAVAAFMNAHFVNIKVDREERPDIDHIYMDAVQSMSGSGGWPLNVFLTPEGKPFYGGTYYPPKAGFNRPSWLEVLQGVANGWSEKKEDIRAHAENMIGHLEQSYAFGRSAGDTDDLFTEQSLHTIAAELLKNADRQWGGFGRAPKFPQTNSIAYLLRYDYFFNDPAAKEQALLSIDAMLHGGIYDQLGGGLARYSTDTEWLVPHFEKMLYDQAQFLDVLADAWQITRNEKYRSAIHQTMDFLERELLSPEGGFYSALDADSEGEEGKFYVWEWGEVEEVLGADAALAAGWYGITAGGNWEGVNILTSVRDRDRWLQEHGFQSVEWNEKLASIRQRLLEKRSTRVRPGLDDKQLLSWNALMNTACSRVYAATGEERYRALAIRNMDWMLSRFDDGEGGLLHTYKEGVAKFPGFLDDYVYLVQALLSLQEVTGNPQYLLKAEALTERVINVFGEEGNALYYYTMAGQPDIVVRKREVYDGAQPSGNAVLLLNLQYLGTILDRPRWAEMAEAMLGAMGKAIVRYPSSFGVWVEALMRKQLGMEEMVVVGPEVETLRKEILANFIPNRIVQSATRENRDFPLLRDKIPKSSENIYICRQYNCLRPVATVREMMGQIRPRKGGLTGGILAEMQ